MDEFGTHMEAARAGCPICKQPLKDLWTDRVDKLTWRNRCQNPKCQGFREYRLKYEMQMAEKPASQSPVPQRHKSTPAIKAPDDWEFVDDYTRWRDIKGDVVKLKELSDDELLDAMHSLREANFAKHGSHIIWMKDLPRKPECCAYPKEKLKIGKDEALAKLEEMREVATERGLLA